MSLLDDAFDIGQGIKMFQVLRAKWKDFCLMCVTRQKGERKIYKKGLADKALKEGWFILRVSEIREREIKKSERTGGREGKK